MTVKSMDEILDRVEHLPRLQDTATRLIAVVADPTSTLEQIVETIRYDQTVTAQILRLCNSAYFGLVRRLSSIDEAIRYIGTTKVLQMVMAVHTQSLLTRPQEGYGLPPGVLWLHSVGVALGSQMLAQRFGITQVGMVFTSGLLHDVGKTVLNEFVAADYAEIARIVADDGVSFVEAEQSVLGFTHPEIGERMAEIWNLPESIARAVRYHHEPGTPEQPDRLIDAVHLADSICRLVGVGCGHDGLLNRADLATMERHGLTETDLESLGADMVIELKAVQKLFAFG